MDIEQTLTDLENAGSELIPQQIDMPNIPDLPNTSNPNLEVTMVNEHFSSNPQAHPSYANALKSPRPRTPSLNDPNDNSPPKKLFNLMQNEGYLNSGHMPPILRPPKNPSKLPQVPAEYIYENPDFKQTPPSTT